jgi:NAD(P)-dependent dehydrogenase (short-subunit alcohol dehydrogenase family)
VRVIAVTGGGQGIGRATALYFARAAYAVSIADVDEEAGAEALRKIKELGAQGIFSLTDVSHPETVKEWMEMTSRDLACPDVLVNNA